MRLNHFATSCILLLTSATFAQNLLPTASEPNSAFVLQDSSPIKLRTNRTLSSAESKTGDQIDFEVLEDVRVNGELIVPKGGTAIGTVTEAQAKRRMARGGKLDITIDYVRLADGEKAALRGVKDTKGGGHTGAMTGAIVATSLVVWPAAPFFLFMHGKDITIPKDTEITAYVNGDMKLDLAKFQAASAAPVVSSNVASNFASNAASGTQAHLQLSSTPDGADIEVDGNFVGNTPSDIDVAPGDHMVSMKKSGYKDWTKNMKITAGSNIHIKPELEKVTR